MTRLFLLLAFVSCQFFSSQVMAGPRLYVFDCGNINLESMAMFNLEDADTDVREMFVPCYLVKHAKGLLLWEGGLPKNIADAEGPVESEGASMVYDTWIVDQLAQMGITPSDIDYAAYSHLHFDHAGAANAFTQSKILMQQKEWDGVFGGDIAFIDTSLFEGLKNAELQFIDGDHDVFGDGSVKLIFSPGHTPGHQVMLIDLENTGKILISGDLYHTHANRRLRKAPTFNVDEAETLRSMDKVEKIIADSGATLWIEHDKALADTLKKAPAFYD